MRALDGAWRELISRAGRTGRDRPGETGRDRAGETGRDAVDRAGAELLGRWAEPHRHYHTVSHLAAVLSIVDQHPTTATDVDAVRLAAWFHDAVYDPRAAPPANEDDSAALAERMLPELDVPAATVAEVARLVRLTAGHAPEPGDLDGALLCDADLAILAADWPAYDAYAGAVRREYAHLPEPVFRAGRAAVLEHLLALPVLFRVLGLDQPARANLARELASTKASG